MSRQRFYQDCQNNIGRAVEMQMDDGQVFRGIIERVEKNKVYLRPLREKQYNGYGYGSFGGGGCGCGRGCGCGWGWGWGFGAGIAIGAIAALFFLPFFW